jgi:hypothetical protein
MPYFFFNKANNIDIMGQSSFCLILCLYLFTTLKKKKEIYSKIGGHKPNTVVSPHKNS